jgi:hypothetical protein
MQLNVFRASLCLSSGAYQLQQQPLVYRRNVVVAVLLVVVGPANIQKSKISRSSCAFLIVVGSKILKTQQ